MAPEIASKLLAAAVVGLLALSTLTTLVIPLAFGLVDRRP